MVAAGQFDAFFERQHSVWDTAAGVKIVEEPAAGDPLTALDGKTRCCSHSNEDPSGSRRTVSTGTVPRCRPECCKCVLVAVTPTFSMKYPASKICSRNIMLNIYRSYSICRLIHPMRIVGATTTDAARVTPLGTAGATALAGVSAIQAVVGDPDDHTRCVRGDGELIKRLLKNHVESEAASTETTISRTRTLRTTRDDVSSEKATYDIVARTIRGCHSSRGISRRSGTTSTRCRPTRSFSRPSTSGPGRRPVRQSRRTHRTLNRN